MPKTILVTGGAGFIGSNFILKFLSKYEKYRVINLDSLTYASDLNYLKAVEKHPRYCFAKGDITDQRLLYSLFHEYSISFVIHFAAESHVDNSITNPSAFMRTNVMGTHCLLEAARNQWLDQPFKLKKDHQKCLFYHISTDEVYGSLGPEGAFTEKTPYAPNSPYSASKAASDMIVRSYFHTYGMPMVMSNCSNNYGPHQHDEKLIPVIIRSALSGQNIPIYGKGNNIRDWLFVEDHCDAIDLVFHNGRHGETYNVGTRNEQNNLSIAREICTILDEIRPLRKGSYQDQITFVKDRPGHDFRYAIDPTKIEKELDWVAQTSFKKGLRKCIEWYLNKYDSSGAIAS